MRAYASYFISILIFIALTTASYGGNDHPDQSSIEKWEYEIMSNLIDAYYGNDFDLLLIDDQTEPWCIRGKVGGLRSEWLDLKAETIDSLIVRNGCSVPLESKLSIESKYRLMSRSSYHEILKASNGPDWDNFDELYPESPGFLVISRIGFDSKYEQALVYFGNAYRCRENRMIPKDRSIAFFVRRNGGWVLRGIEKGFRSFYYE
jgi:hypothetical protein